MATLELALSESLARFVDQQASSRGFPTAEDYVQDLLCKEMARFRLRGLLLEGACSPLGERADRAFFDGLRKNLQERTRS